MLDLTPVGPGRTVDDALYDALRRDLRGRLICAALTGMLTVSKDKDALTDIARAAILQADAVLDALDREG